MDRRDSMQLVYPWMWAVGVLEDFLSIRRRAAEDEMIAQDKSYDDVVEMLSSDQEAWRDFKKRVREREKAWE